MIRERRLATDRVNRNGISRDENRIIIKHPNKVSYYNLNVIPAVYIRYGRLITYSGSRNDISDDENRDSNTKTTNKGLSPRSKIAPAAYIRYIRIIGTHYLLGKPVYNSAG